MNSPPKGIHLISGVFWIFLIGGFIPILGRLAGLSSAQEFSIADMAFNTLMRAVIIYGINKKKIWLVPFVLFYAYLSLLRELALVALTEVTAINMLGQKFVHMVLAVFFIYLVVVFSRKETKLYYEEKGQTII